MSAVTEFYQENHITEEELVDYLHHHIIKRADGMYQFRSGAHLHEVIEGLVAHEKFLYVCESLRMTFGEVQDLKAILGK